MSTSINGEQLKQMLLFGAATVIQEQQEINDLNVFPVPDGDTGTNMSMTMQAAATELQKIQAGSVSQVADITANALLRGARGNSGVILSLLFRGIAKAWKGLAESDGIAFAKALQEGVASAYGAVMKPAEGTVLTVSRLAAKRAGEAAKEVNDFEYVLQEAIDQAEKTLAETTQMNPVLKKANVVDAGGKGLIVILKGMLRSLRGEEVPAVFSTVPSTEPAERPFDRFATEDIRFSYCTEFIVSRNKSGKDPQRLRAFLNEIGDSLVLVEDESILKVHVHTNHPGTVLEEALTYGPFLSVKVENMKEQHTAILSESQAETSAKEPQKPIAYIAVCAGDGLAAVFQDLGADAVVSGGQTMNPSTEDILKEVEQVAADTVIILPNNKNIILAAQQCASLTDKNILVVESKTVPQGIAAMMVLTGEETDGAAVAAAMDAAMQKVTTLQITYAARDSEFDGKQISAGDYLLLHEGKLHQTGKDFSLLIRSLASLAQEKDPEFITVFSGSDAKDSDTETVRSIFAEVCPHADVTVLPGGQPVYYYIISVE